ncbi:MAG: beta-ketoacyl-[acyl-carrier-protein] synthase family protein [Planctomycetales bacterium]
MAGNTALRVVITGVGVVSPVGTGKDRFWDNLLQGRSGVDFLRSFPNMDLPSKFAAEVRDFDPLRYLKQKKMLKVMSRDIQLGVAAASLAFGDSGLKTGDYDPDRLGVEYGAGNIAIDPTDLAEAAAQCAGDSHVFEFDRFNGNTMGEIGPLWLLKHLPNMPACHVAIQHDARGPNNTITCRDSSALLALDEAVRVIQRGSADAMIVGACSSNIHPVDIARMNLLNSLSRREDDPSRACRPFDMNRDGTIVGEGAAAFIVESYEHAVHRGAEIYAEILGIGAGCDGSDDVSRVGSTGIVRAIQSALRKAQIDPREVGHINAHGNGTIAEDTLESRAYHRALGAAAENIPVTGLKCYFGNFDAGSGAVELAGSVLALRHGQIPMTLNYETPDPLCRLNVIHGEAQRVRSSTALSVNRTQMGQSAAVLIRSI